MNLKSGYILIFSMIMIAGAVGIITTVLFKAMSQSGRSTVMLDRVQARMLALSGLEIAMSELFVKESELEKAQAKFIKKINKWKTYNFNDQVAPKSSVSIYISSESGKLNLNDFQYWFVLDGKSIDPEDLFESQKLQEVAKKGEKIISKISEAVRKFSPAVKLLTDVNKKIQSQIDIIKILEDANYKLYLEDATDLYGQSFRADLKFDLFRAPQEFDSIVLTDLFTGISSSIKDHENPTVQLWGLSKSLIKIFGSNSIDLESKSEDELKKIFKDAKTFSELYAGGILELYNNENTKSFFSSKFEPEVFSVLSYGSVGLSKCKLFALLKRDRSSKDIRYKITKIYWI